MSSPSAAVVAHHLCNALSVHHAVGHPMTKGVPSCYILGVERTASTLRALRSVLSPAARASRTGVVVLAEGPPEAILPDAGDGVELVDDDVESGSESDPSHGNSFDSGSWWGDDDLRMSYK